MRPQRSTAEYVAELLDEEGKQTKPPAFTQLSRVSKPVTELMWAAFDGYSLALVSFLDKVLLPSRAPPENWDNHYLVMTTQQYTFLELFVEHCRETKLEKPLTADVDGTANGTSVPVVAVYKPNEPMPDGAKNVIRKRQNTLVSFHSSHRLRVRYVDKRGHNTDRDYETAMAIKVLCHTLGDARLKGKLNRLIEIPPLIFRSLLATADTYESGKNPKGGETRRQFIETLLSDQARTDPWVSFQFRCPLIYDAALLDADVHHKEALIESNKRLKSFVEKQPAAAAVAASSDRLLDSSSVDVERLTLSVYLYYRLVINGLNVPATQSETAFCVVMYLFEEAVNPDVTRSSGLLLANNESAEAAKRDISSNPALFEGVMFVAAEAVRFVMSLTNRLPAGAKQPKTIASIYESAKTLKLGLDRIRTVDRAKEQDSDKLRRMFFWQRNLQVTWRLVERELTKHLSPVRAKNVRDFAEAFPECCAFMIDPRVNSDAFTRSVRHLNKMHPSFRFVEVSFDAAGRLIEHGSGSEWLGDITEPRYVPQCDLDVGSGGDEEEAACIAYQRAQARLASSRGLRSGSRFCVINDGPSRRCFILFDTPKSHQRFCNFSLMEALTTAQQEKHLPMYPFLLRQYCGVFGRFEWCPTDLSKLANVQKIYAQVLVNDFGEKGPLPSTDTPTAAATTTNDHMRPNFSPANIDDVDLSDDHENLWLFVKTLFFQLSSYSITGLEGCQRLSDFLLSDVLLGNEREFKTYRFTHRICATLSEYMSDFPYFTLPNQDTKRPKSATKAAAVPPGPREPHVIDDIAAASARGKGLMHTAAVLLCFLCLGAVHTLNGDTIFRLRKYLHSLPAPESERHLALRTYLDLLDSYNANRNIIVEGELVRRVQLVFNRELAHECNVHLRVPGVFDELIFPERYGHATPSVRREVSRINSLLYRFTVDKLMSIDMRGQVLFDLDHQRQFVKSEEGTNNNGAAPTDADSVSSVASRFFKKPTSPVSRKRTERSCDSVSIDDSFNDDNSSQASAALHATEVLGTKATAVARLARIDRLHRAPARRVKTSDLPMRMVDREEMPIYDVYRGLQAVRASGPLKQLCSGYQDALCYDLVYDLGKSVVYRGLEVAVKALEREVAKSRNVKTTTTTTTKAPAPPKARTISSAEALEKEHQFIISMLSKSSPPSIVRGMYRGRGAQGPQQLGDSTRMREAYATVMASAQLEAPQEPEGRTPFLKCNFGQRSPIAYAPGNYDSMVSVLGSLTHLGKWRYEVAAEFRMASLLASDAACPEYQTTSMQPMCEFMKCLEWMLYRRCPSLEAVEQRKREPNDLLNSPKFWHIDADRFVWYQLNSKLPVDFNTLSYEEILHQMLDDSDLKDQLKKHQQESAASEDGGDEEERLMIESILREDTSEAQEEKALSGGELSDIADHFWTIKAPLAFLDNGGWTLRLTSQEKETEASLARGGGPPASEGLTLILEEYAQTVSNLVHNAPTLSEDRLEATPAARFIRSRLAERTEEQHKDKKARVVPLPPRNLPVPAASRRSPPRDRPTSTSLSPVDFDIQLDDYGSNVAPTALAMSWPGQLYIGQRSASTARHTERQQLSVRQQNGHRD